jgi:hypothetical protein
MDGSSLLQGSDVVSVIFQYFQKRNDFSVTTNTADIHVHALAHKVKQRKLCLYTLKAYRGRGGTPLLFLNLGILKTGIPVYCALIFIGGPCRIQRQTEERI